MDPAPDITVTWEPLQMSGIALDRWYARVTAPVVTELFACVNCTIQGQWYVHLSPNGRQCLPDLYGDVGNPAHGKRQVERWARHHWRQIPVQARRAPTA